VLASAVEGPDGGPLTDAAEHLADAARQPRGVRPDTGLEVHVLRDVAGTLQQLGPLLPEDVGMALRIVGNLTRIARTLSGDGDRHAARGAGRLGAFAGTPTPRDVAHLVAALGPERAAAVAAEPAWPALAAQLRLLERQGLDAGAELRRAAGRRELGSADSVAAVLHYRLTVEGPSTAPTRSSYSPVPRATAHRGPGRP